MILNIVVLIYHFIIPIDRIRTFALFFNSWVELFAKYHLSINMVAGEVQSYKRMQCCKILPCSSRTESLKPNCKRDKKENSFIHLYKKKKITQTVSYDRLSCILNFLCNFSLYLVSYKRDHLLQIHIRQVYLAQEAS